MQDEHYEQITCRVCGEAFQISESEKSFYIEKGLEVPKRCLRCRSIAREKKKTDISVCCAICHNCFSARSAHINLNTILVCGDCRKSLLDESHIINADVYGVISKEGVFYYHGN